MSLSFDTSLHTRATAVFGEVCELAPEDRRRRLDAECAGEPALRGAVERLLRGLEGVEGFLEQPALGSEFSLVAAAHKELGGVVESGGSAQRFGAFCLTRVIGAGGFSVVYEAEQDHPRRTVALKVLRTGLLSDLAMRRFRMEAEVLGKLRHPGIAGVHAAGLHAESPGDRGTPYFAMELVRGRSITEAARELPLRGKLELFVQVCNAVQHAHQHGVIHRDLKPANILVDERGCAKVLDFGVARVTNLDFQTMSMHTEAGALVGTVPYMSPEQVGGNHDSVDTRSDVYALGVILFELLAGRPPYDTRTKSIPEAARIIREQEPTRLGSIDAMYRGDLETIVARALEKDASRRYVSADALAADVRRHLEHKPIEARPATRMYQVRKFARRHPELVLGMGIAVLALMAGLAGTSWGMFRATQQRSLALTQAMVAKENEAIADRKATTARRVAAAMEKILNAANPLSAAGYLEGPVEVLSQAARDIGADLAGEPDAEWSVRMALARSFEGLGANEPRTWSLWAAESIAQKHFPPDDPRTVETARALVNAYWCWIAQGTAHERVRNEAPGHSERVYEEARGTLGEWHPTTISLMRDHAAITGKLPVHRRLVETLRLMPAEDRPVPLALALSHLAHALAYAGEDSAGRSAADEALDLIRNKSEPKDWQTLTDVGGLHTYLDETGRLQEALVLVQDQVQRLETELERTHPRVMANIHWLAGAYHRLGDNRRARILSGESLAGMRMVTGRQEADNIFEMMRHAHYLAIDQRIDEARSMWLECFELIKPYGNDSLILQRDNWCAAQLTCGLRGYGPWASESLRAEAFFAFFQSLSGGTPSMDLNDVSWSDFQFSLKRFDATDLPPASGGLEALWALPEPAPGLYRVRFSVPVLGVRRNIDDWVFISPWRVHKFSSHHRNLSDPDHWAARRKQRPDEVADVNTLTSIGWPAWKLGPHGRPYYYGLVAETVFELPEGEYEFALDADDWGTLYLDGRELAAAHAYGGLMTNAHVSAGSHTLRVEFVQGPHLARLRLRVRPLPPS